MKVYILDNGWLECDRNWMVAMSVHGTRENPNPRAQWTRIPVYAVLVDHPDGKIRSYENRYHARVMFPHDTDFFNTMTLAPGYYE